MTVLETPYKGRLREPVAITDPDPESGPAGSAPVVAKGGIGLQQALLILRRRWSLVFKTLLAGVALAIGYLFATTPVYMATGQIIFDLRQPRIISDNPILQSLGADQSVVDSQVEVLQSPTIAQRVVDKIGAEKLLKSKPVATLSPAALKKFDEQSKRLSTDLLTGLSVRRKGLSFVIDVSYTDPDPQRAALLVNEFMDAYLAEQRDGKIGTISTVNKWLSLRVEELRVKAAEAEERLQAFKSSHNVVEGTQSMGPEAELAEYGRQMAVARAALAEAQARVQQVEEYAKHPEMLSSLPQTIESRVIIELRGLLAKLKAKQALAVSRFGAQHPQAQEAQAELDKMMQQITEEITRIVESTRSAYDIAAGRVDMLSGKIEDVKRQLNKTGESKLGLAELEREVKVTSAMYANFLTRLKEAQAQETLQSPDARVVSAAVAPLSPAKPKKLVVLGLAAGLGLGLGLMLAFVRDGLQTAFETPSDFTFWAGSSLLASVPTLDVGAYGGAAPEGDPDCQDVRGDVTESAAGENSASTGPTFALLEVLRDRGHPFTSAICLLSDALESSHASTRARVVAVISPRQSRAGSEVAQSLAHYAAMLGHKTLLVDCHRTAEEILADPMLHPAVHSADGEPRGARSDALLEDHRSKLKILPALRAPNGADGLVEFAGPFGLATQITKLARSRDLIIVDAPAFLESVHTRLLMRVVTHALVFVKIAETLRADVSATVDAIAATQPKFIGFVAGEGEPGAPEPQGPLDAMLQSLYGARPRLLGRAGPISG